MKDRPDEVIKLLGDIRGAIEESYSGYLIRELLAEAIFGEVQCPGPLAREIAIDLLDCIANHEWITHRKSLLRFALSGLNSASTRDLVRERIEKWLFRAEGWSLDWYEPLISWPDSDQVEEILFTALNDEDVRVQQGVFRVIAGRFTGDERIAHRLANIARSALDLGRRTHALMALALGWPEHNELPAVIEQARNARCDELLFGSAASAVFGRQAQDSDLSTLLYLCTGKIRTKLGYEWNEILTSVLVQGFKGNKRLKEECLGSLGQPFKHEYQIDREIATSVLLQAFPDDSDVAQYCVAAITARHRSPFSSFHLEPWKLLAKNFAGNSLLTKVVDEWILSQEGGEPEVSWAALITKSDSAKNKLIHNLNSRVPFWAAESLLRGWSMNDSEAADALYAAATGNAKTASAIARSIPEILSDPFAARQRLLSLLQDKESPWKHWVLRGLLSMSDRGDEEEIVEAALKVRDSVHPMDQDSFDSALIVRFSQFREVKMLAERRLRER